MGTEGEGLRDCIREGHRRGLDGGRSAHGQSGGAALQWGAGVQEP